MSRSGSDWQEYNVLDLATPQAARRQGRMGQGLGHRVARQRLLLQPLSRTPAKGKELSSINEDHQVYYHRIGTPQSADELVFSDPKNPQRFHTLQTTEDERFAVLDVSDRGTGKQGNAVFVQDLSKPGSKFTPLIPEIGDDTYNVLESVRGELLVFTDNERAERPRRPHRSRESGAGELEGDPRREARHDRHASRWPAARSSPPT